MLLSTAYLPPVQYLSKFLLNEEIWIEACENFTKQTYRNRCHILSANGVDALTIPVVKGNSKQLMKDVQIAYDTPWQYKHWNAIVSAYNSSPFFEILADDFRPFYERKFNFLLDFNQELLQLILDILEIDKTIKLTPDFELFDHEGINLREAINSKASKIKKDEHFCAHPYPQVFDNKFDFQPNLSVIDLLFNCGSASYETILRSIV
ncbi:MAG: WbqC family protein [Mangrovibacterium sp.]